MKILVTGCAGFIGSHLAEALLNQGHDVVGIDNFHPYYDRELKMANLAVLIQYKNFSFIEDSILNFELMKILTKNVSLVYHEAAIAGTRYSIEFPSEYIEINVMGTLNVLEAARLNNVKKIVFASSSSVYGEIPLEELPINEEHKLNAISPYAHSKIMAEELCKLYTKIYKLPVVILRYFTVWGPRQRPDEAFAKFITKILKNETIEVYGDGLQTRDFTYIDDIVNGTILAAEKGHGIYNLGSGTSLSVNGMINKIASTMKAKPKVKFIEKHKADVSHTLADITKAKNELGYKPSISLQEGIKRHVDWCRHNV